MNRRQLGYRYFMAITILFLLFVGSFVFYQSQREKDYKIELLNTNLQNINDRIIDDLPDEERYFNQYITTIKDNISNYEGLRITIITTDGKVIYDSESEDLTLYENHLHRKEIEDALKKGHGYDIIRQSKSANGKYFYSASYRNNTPYVVRCAVPYSVEMERILKSENNYLLFTGVITILLLFLFLKITNKVNRSISEKEKLLAHLSISREGLGIFDYNCKLILANTLFNQYGNLISDSNPAKTENIIQIPEMAPIRDFLNKEKYESHDETDEPCISFSIEKNSCIYMINCVLFQDNGFEISINEITTQAAQSKLKHDLTQNIAHELKTPVSSIQGYLEIINNSLDKGSLPPDKLRYFIERCYSQSTRLTNLLQDISTLSRMGDTSRTVEKERIDIAQIVNNLLNEVALKLDEQNMKVDNRLPDSLMINGNSSMIYSIFRNLTDNAISYAGKGCIITISCFDKDDKYYYFSFADNGTGVPEEHLGRIFERFYRVDKGRSRKLGGTGLGLAIVKNAISVHGGNISVKNRKSGGLEFIFSLKIK